MEVGSQIATQIPVIVVVQNIKPMAIALMLSQHAEVSGDNVSAGQMVDRQSVDDNVHWKLRTVLKAVWSYRQFPQFSGQILSPLLFLSN
jgi:hypothetical protein